MIDRTQSPPFNPIGTIHFIQPKLSNLSNGIPVYILASPVQELVRIEIIVSNVHFDPANPLVTMAVSALLKNGTLRFNAMEIAESIDELGAFLDTTYAQDQIIITLYSLNKHLERVLPVLEDVLSNAFFPQTEIDIYKRNQQERLQVNLQKNDFLSRKHFSHALFGDTAYGADIKFEDYEKIKRSDLQEYHSAAFIPQNFTIIASGNFTDNDFALLDKNVGAIARGKALPEPNRFHFKPTNAQKLFIERPDAVQSAIRIGAITIRRDHPDYPGLSVLSCTLGGYFGSRLMANVREDKGYTYGIGSAVVSLKQAGYFFIATEVGTNVCRPALEEIYKEIDLLRSTLVPHDELELVRNYMLGSLLGSLENIFSHADKFKNLLLSDLEHTYYERFIQTVKTIQPEQIKALANQYLKPETFVELVVGSQGS